MESLKKFIDKPKLLSDFIKVGTLRSQIDEAGLPLDLELIIPAFSNATYRHPKIPLEQFRDSLSHHQIFSKAWIVKTIVELPKFYEDNDENLDDRMLDLELYRGSDISIAVFGSWLGFSSAIVSGVTEYFSYQPQRVTMVDMDQAALDFSQDFMVEMGYNIRLMNEDMANIHPEDDVFKSDLIVNCSLEHMSLEQYARWWDKILSSKIERKKRLIVLQSTNMKAADHIQKMEKVTDLTAEGLDVLYRGELQFADCSRFMVLGAI